MKFVYVGQQLLLVGYYYFFFIFFIINNILFPMVIIKKIKYLFFKFIKLKLNFYDKNS